MFIGYLENVKYSYSRPGGKPIKEPVVNENGSVEWAWSENYCAPVIVNADLGRECYVGAVTLPLTEKARVAGVKILVDGKVVGKHLAEPGKVISGSITVPVGVTASSLAIRIENTGATVVGFFEPRISVCYDDNAPLVWPVPKHQTYSDGYVTISSVEAGAGKDAAYAKGFLEDILDERFGNILSPDGVKVTLKISKAKAYASERYTVSVTEDGITLTAGKRITLLYAVYALVALCDDGAFRLAEIDTCPSREWRGYHMGLPKVENIPFAKSFMRDILVALGYNMIFVQIIGCMEFEKHPEITEAWLRENKRAVEEYNTKFPHYYMGCEGESISKKQVADLMDYAHELGLEVIPEVQSLGHVQWITTSHPEIAEIDESAEEKLENTSNEDARPTLKYHHCYCPSNEKSYEILFDVMDEIIEVTKPDRYVHIGHDEVYYMGLCNKCKGTPHDVLFARDVNRIYNHLKELGYGTMMWSDMIQPVTKYQTPGAIKMLPKDIVMLDFIWYFHLGLDIEENLFPEGYTVIAGNLYSSHYPRYRKRMTDEHMRGGEVSSWCEVNEYRMGKKGKFWDLTYTAEMLWNPENYNDDMRTVFSHVISSKLQPTQRDLIRGKYSKTGYAETPIAIPLGNKTDIPRELLAVYPNARIADGTTVKVGGKYERLVIEHTALEIEKRVPWAELKLSGEYTVTYTDGTSFIARAEYAGGVLHYDRHYGDPLPEAVHRHTGYIGTWFSDPVYEGKTEHGEDLLVLGYVVENPNPDKEIATVSYTASETDISNVVLCAIKGLNPNT